MSVSSLATQSRTHLCFLLTELNVSLKRVTKYQLVDMVGVRGTWFPYSAHGCLLGHPLVLIRWPSQVVSDIFLLSVQPAPRSAPPWRCGHFSVSYVRTLFLDSLQRPLGSSYLWAPSALLICHLVLRSPLSSELPPGRKHLSSAFWSLLVLGKCLPVSRGDFFLYNQSFTVFLFPKISFFLKALIIPRGLDLACSHSPPSSLQSRLLPWDNEAELPGCLEGQRHW